MGSSLSSEPVGHTLYLAGILLAFVVGAAVSGFLVHDSTLKLGRHYDTALVLEAGLLFVSLYLLSQGSQYGHYLASAACGLQNALATTYSGAIVRTTHLTGIFTDLGIMLGSAFRGDAFDKRKAILFLLIIGGFIIGGFIIGGTVGAYAFSAYRFNALVAPALICLALAGIYHLYAGKHH